MRFQIVRFTDIVICEKDSIDSKLDLAQKLKVEISLISRYFDTNVLVIQELYTLGCNYDSKLENLLELLLK